MSLAEILYAQRKETGDFALCCADSSCCPDACETIHKSVLAAASPVFKAMLYGSMIESMDDALASKLIPDAKTLQEVVHSCYTLKFDSTVPETTLEALHALQVSCELSNDSKPQQDWNLFFWDMYAQKNELSAKHIEWIIEKKDPRCVPILQQYNLSAGQIREIEVFAQPSAELYRTSALCVGKGQQKADENLRVGLRVRYIGANLRLHGCAGTIADVLTGTDYVVRFDHDTWCVLCLKKNLILDV